MKLSPIILFFIAGGAMALAEPVFGAQLFFKHETPDIPLGQEFSVSVQVDTSHEYMNAVEGTLTFDGAILELERINDANSIVNFWITRPAAAGSGAVDFSGITPGGWQGNQGLLFSLVFKAKASGITTLNIQHAKVLLNDGKGTSASLKVSPEELSISKTTSTFAPPETVKDVTPPEHFTPEIARSSEAFDGKWFLVFAAQDKGGGIDHYEVKEGLFGKFKTAQSPYVLQNQPASQQVSVKAVDKSGNERIEKAYPPDYQPWYKSYGIFGIIMLVIILGIYAWRRFKK